MDNHRVGVTVVAAILHLCFAMGEMFPWQCPVILGALLRSLRRKKNVEFTGEQLRLTATIVRNAGIYNVIVAAGFLGLIFPGEIGFPSDPAALKPFECFFFGAALVAGLFGLTLSRATLIQAIVGALGLYLTLT
jgi:hypothetical protein